jgi:hypothetical protein
MGMLAQIYDSPLGNCSNNGISSKAKQVCIVNVEGPFDPSDDAPAVKLIKRERVGNITTSDSRFGHAVQRLSGYDHSFPVALHDRVE